MLLLMARSLLFTDIRRLQINKAFITVEYLANSNYICMRILTEWPHEYKYSVFHVNCHEHHNFHGMSRRMQAFFAIKLPY
jgi:hypothetical protein